jgi:hypothetical protein
VFKYSTEATMFFELVSLLGYVQFQGAVQMAIVAFAALVTLHRFFELKSEKRQ